MDFFCFNTLTGQDCSGKCTIGPEKHRLGPENRKFASSLVGSATIAVLRGVGARFSGARRPISGAIATAMARPGRIGPEIPAEWGHACRVP
jgi:hypothetical protein